MQKWVYVVPHRQELPFGVFRCAAEEDGWVEFAHKGERHRVPVEMTRPVEPPAFDYGDIVCLRGHPEESGTVIEIGYHFSRGQHTYILRIGGKRSSKRYCGPDLALK